MELEKLNQQLVAEC